MATEPMSRETFERLMSGRIDREAWLDFLVDEGIVTWTVKRGRRCYHRTPCLDPDECARMLRRTLRRALRDRGRFGGSSGAGGGPR